ncbi:chymotrypsin-like elastase family member 2A [Arctopsyche grandis]|uniref:chymotrypsin-like elastase family member 2A n=1 Tax=Arctopsyche grandis TaxID=121162 RepID=UPI00406D88AE
MKTFNYLVLTTLLCAITLLAVSAYECGVPIRRHYRHPREVLVGSVRIIKGRESRRGAWPWQVSLQLLHPKFGFIGHWCGGVLIHPMWILTAAHCIHNELFNLPIAALWTAVLGEWDRSEQSGAYVPVERIILHGRYHHYQHDIALMKLSKSADISSSSKIRIICLPENIKLQPQAYHKNNMKISQFYSRPKQSSKPQLKYDNKSKINNAESSFKYLEQISNITKSVLNNLLTNKQKNLKYNIRVAINETNRRTDSKPSAPRFSAFVNNVFVDESKENESENSKEPRNNAKKLHFASDSLYDVDALSGNHLDEISECYVTGWGRSQTNGSLTDTLLEASVPPLPIEACMGKYPENLPLRAGHLCAGNTDGSSGTCVGDSGGPLQCFGDDGRWMLKGITSFGSGCAKPGVPDVYTYVPHYMSWIKNVINTN